MRNLDIKSGFNSLGIPNSIGSKRCPHPGPNQQGFDEYISVLDGPGAPRQNNLQTGSILYSQGCNYLIKNDTFIGNSGNPIGNHEYLFDCEVRHAIRMMSNAIKQNKPFFINLWFHSPHGPWETISEYQSIYQKKLQLQYDECKLTSSISYCKQKHPLNKFGYNKFDSYRTMITGMDHSIGILLNSIKESFIFLLFGFGLSLVLTNLDKRVNRYILFFLLGFILHVESEFLGIHKIFCITNCEIDE
jgi:hypothetical protein